MNNFLKDISSLLLSEYGDSLADHCIVFPNNRSILFFRKYLSEIIDRPLFLPSLKTISDLLKDRSDLNPAEPVQLVYELYNTFKESGISRNTFDEFYHWGEMLINDFDDVDKYMADPEILFSNLADLKEIDRKFGAFDDEIIDIIKQFWISFDASNMTSEKSDFLSLWESLPRIYNDYTRRLKEKKLAYEGMIFREQAEDIRSLSTAWYDKVLMFHFVGFNALNKCERIILRELKKDGRARFYWDYHPSWVNDPNHEAGFFIRQNISEYGADYIITEQKLPDITINIYSAPSDVSQAKLIPSLPGEDYSSDDPNDTAIILADENLLSPVLNSLPEYTGNINVTMGYPLYHTPVYSLVRQLLRMHGNKGKKGEDAGFWYNDVISILQHQYIVFDYHEDSESVIGRIKENNLIRVGKNDLAVNDFFRMIFSEEFNNRNYISSILYRIIDILDGNGKSGGESTDRLSLQQEYIFSLILPLNQLSAIIEESGMDPGLELYTRLVDRIMRSIVIPFSGEPLQGLQVMGILETRSLDFRNIILLSANEGKIPKSPPGNTYIPYNLREAFGLPTVKHSDSIYAYYFYRLLHRAEKISLVYNSSTDGMRSGEMSRYLLQLMYDDNYNTALFNTRYNILPATRLKNTIKRNDSINELLEDKYLSINSSHKLSPSAINTWIDCNMKFYYRYIAGIREPEEVLEEVDSPAFGNILHHVLKEIYEPYLGKTLDGKGIEKIIKSKEIIRELVEKSFRQVFMKNNKAVIKGKNLVITSLIERMALRILEADIRSAPLQIVSLEKDYEAGFDFITGTAEKTVSIRGTIDRVDISKGITRIIDYKSGADSLEINNLERMFDYNAPDRNSAAFQTLLYCEIFMYNSKMTDIRPSLYPVRKIFTDYFDDTFLTGKGSNKEPLRSYSVLRHEFIDRLKHTLSDIFDGKREFEMTPHEQKCRYCPYNSLCNRREQN